jgi:flagellar motor protein MotB
MKWDEFSRGWLLLLLLAAFFLGAAISRAGAQEVQPAAPSLQQSKPKPINPWNSFDSLWSELKEELKQSEMDSKMQLKQLLELQTETSELQSSYQELMQSFRKSEAARMTEREAAEKALKEAYSKLDAANYAIMALGFTTACFATIAAILGLMLAR